MLLTFFIKNGWCSRWQCMGFYFYPIAKKNLGCKKIIIDTCISSQGVKDFRTKKIWLKKERKKFAEKDKSTHKISLGDRVSSEKMMVWSFYAVYWNIIHLWRVTWHDSSWLLYWSQESDSILVLDGFLSQWPKRNNL